MRRLIVTYVVLALVACGTRAFGFDWETLPLLVLKPGEAARLSPEELVRRASSASTRP